MMVARNGPRISSMPTSTPAAGSTISSRGLHVLMAAGLSASMATLTIRSLCGGLAAAVRHHAPMAGAPAMANCCKPGLLCGLGGKPGNELVDSGGHRLRLLEARQVSSIGDF